MEQFFTDGHLVRVNNDSREWCAMKVELTERNGTKRLSITGMAGYWLLDSEAKRQSIEFWESHFENDRDHLAQMALDHGKRTPASAARYVVTEETRYGGDYPGIDVVLHGAPQYTLKLKTKEKQVERTFCAHSCGQIVDELRKWFPEFAQYLPWHLNDMRAGCEHQEKLGWNHTAMGVACPECGYRYGSAWLVRELPANVIAWAENFARSGEVSR